MPTGVPLTNLEVAMNKAISRELYDYLKDNFSFLGLLAAIDTTYKVSSRVTKSEDVEGAAMQWEFRSGLPTTVGVNALTGAMTDIEIQTPQQGFSWVGTTSQWAHYQLREDIRKATIMHLSDPASLVPHVKKVAEAARDSVLMKINEDLFPSVNLAPSLASGSGGATNGNQSENKILSVGYPLCSGWDNNAATGTTPAQYLLGDKINLNDSSYEGIKAVSPGNTSTGFGALSLTNLRTKLLLPLKVQRGGRPDIGICDSTAYDAMCTVVEGKIQITNAGEKYNYGGDLVRYGQLDWLPEGRLDLLNAANKYRVAYVLQTDTWEFRQQGMMKDFALIQNPNTAALMTMLGFFCCGLVCKNPRLNGMAFNIS